MDLSILLQFRSELWQGIQITLFLTLVGILGSLAVGAVMGIVAYNSRMVISSIVLFTIDFLRNVPVVVKLFLFYFVLNMSPMWSAGLSLVLHQSSYIADTFLSGLRSIPQE